MKLLERLPHCHITINGERYLTKYHLGKLFGIAFNLHQFHKPDHGRDVHSHPWAWARSFILKGSYTERVTIGVDTESGLVYNDRRVRWYNKLNGMSTHKILQLHNGPVWTLFVMGPRIQRWGFLEPTITQEGFRMQYVPYPDRVDDTQYTEDHGYFEAIRK